MDQANCGVVDVKSETLLGTCAGQVCLLDKFSCPSSLLVKATHLLHFAPVVSSAGVKTPPLSTASLVLGSGTWPAPCLVAYLVWRFSMLTWLRFP